MRSDELYHVIETTWPAESRWRRGPFTLRNGAGGGKRVSAATAEAPFDLQDLAEAEAAMRGLDQDPLFMVRAGEDKLDAYLADQSYRVIDPVTIYGADVAALNLPQPPAVSAFCHWPILAVQEDVWAHGGIDTARLNVMKRAAFPKSSLMARVEDDVAGAGFVAISDGIAMIHALEVAEKYRRRRAGFNMMCAAAHWAQDQGAHTLTLVVTNANTAANALYLSLGMRVVGHYHYRIKSDEAE